MLGGRGKIWPFALAILFTLVACTEQAPLRTGDAGDAGTSRADAAGVDAAMESGAAAPDSDAADPPPVDAATQDGFATPDVTGASSDADSAASGPEEEVRCEIGIASGDGGLAFAPAPIGETLPLIGGSQGSLSVELGLRVLEPPLPIDVRVVVRAIASGRNEIALRHQEDDFACDADGWCSLAPFYVPTWTLVDDPFDLMLLDVVITATFGDPGKPHCLATLSGALERK